MSGHSILYLGRGEFATAYLAELETLSCCTYLTRSVSLELPTDASFIVDIILLEVGPTIALSGRSLGELISSFAPYPVIALTQKDNEHRGIAAVRAGAQGYICIDDVTVDTQETMFEHVVKRAHMQSRMSTTDVSVLSILKNINDGVIVVDSAGHVLDINPAARTVLGMSPRMQPDPTWERTFCCIDENGNSYRNSADLPLMRARSGEKYSNQVAIYRKPEQPDIILSINGQGLYDGNRELIGGVITFRDVTESQRRTSELERRAQFDDLTGLANRALFLEQLTRAIGRSQRKSTPLAALFVDLDRFKSINDTLGHDTGDALLRQVANRLQSNIRIGDFCGRWAGDEFVVCLEDFGVAGNAAAAAQKLSLVLSEKYETGNSEVYVTPSIGIAMYPEAGTKAEQLIRAADVAMLEAKKRGGGRFQYYSEALNTRLAQREELEAGLRHALVRNEFVLHYQPRIDLASNRLIGLEALLRWQHPRFGLLPPARFLPILESSGLIQSAGEWVIDSACRQLAAWQRRFELPDLSIAINLSPQQLIHERLVKVISKAIADTALDPGCVELEICDGDLVQKRETEREVLGELRKVGVRLSLDHFGARDVSFESIDSGFIDSFVLDQTLLADIEENDSHQRIVRAAIAMAQGLDIEVTAEGVETVKQLEFLKSCNCNLAQGFLISRPMQPEKIAAILRSESAGTRLLAASVA
jgi:diguanylate cyclase (GGDEF)-like protein/PAS domain S-box-containing protein